MKFCLVCYSWVHSFNANYIIIALVTYILVLVNVYAFEFIFIYYDTVFLVVGELFWY